MVKLYGTVRFAKPWPNSGGLVVESKVRKKNNVVIPMRVGVMVATLVVVMVVMAGVVEVDARQDDGLNYAELGEMEAGVVIMMWG